MFDVRTDGPLTWTTAWVGLVAALLYQIYRLYVRHVRWVQGYDQLPTRKDKHWFWGHMHQHPGPGEDGIRYQLEHTRLFPRFHAAWFGRLMCVIVAHHPDTVKDILRASAHIATKPTRAGSIYATGRRWLGDGLLLANGQKWARNRRLLTPAFHFDMLKSYMNVKNSCTDILLTKMEHVAETGESFEVFHHIGLCSLDIITQCAFSYQTNCQTRGEKSAYVQAVHRLSELWVKRSLNVLHTFDMFYFNLTKDGREFNQLSNLVHGVSEDIIEKRRQTLKGDTHAFKDDNENKKQCKDFLDIILTARDEDGQGLSHLDVRNEVDTFLFEGHDTTASAMSFILLSLAQHPDIQEKCRQEIDQIVKDRKSDEIQYEDLSKMEYLTQCIKESLRLSSPVFVIARQMVEDFKVDGNNIPKDTIVVINLHNLHNNGSVWGEDHEEYRPERFESETVRKMDTFAFLPFSAGQRNCIGQNFAMNEIKIIISRLLHRYVFTVTPGHTVEKRLAVVMRTKDGIWLNAKKREQSDNGWTLT